MIKDYDFSKGDYVRVVKGSFASFYGRVVRVNNDNQRLTLEGWPEGEQDSELHSLNVSFSVVEKADPPQN
jgi:ribosomal protein L24